MASASPKIHDLVIVGAGPAGCAAALTARRRRAGVQIIECENFPRPRCRTGWLSPKAVELADGFGVRARTISARVFRGLRLHSWDLRSSVAIDEDDLTGWFVDRSAFDQALLLAATKAGAQARMGTAPARVTLGEEHVTLHLDDGGEVRGRIMLLADGAVSRTAAQAKMTPAGRAPNVPLSMYAEFEPGGKNVALDVAIGASRAGQIATLVRNKGRARLSLITRDREQPLREQFDAFCASAVAAGLLPDGLALEPTPGHAVAGVALDMDTLVGKRCLLIGDAGGFVSAFSGEGVYPAMRSGCIAAESALRALEATVVQDELAGYGTAWRSELADYLRMPNTDLALLMPLVFGNEQMSRRVARAFLLGHQF